MYINRSLLDQIKQDETLTNCNLTYNTEGYFIINILYIQQLLFVKYITQEIIYNSVEKIIHLYGKTCKDICNIILQNQFIITRISPSHYMYLGRELTKAEMALILNQKYIQN